MCLFLGFLSCSVDLYFCFCARTILFSWLQLCSIVWSWLLQVCFSFSWLLWLFRVLCVFIQILIFFGSSSVKYAIGNMIGIALNLSIVLGSIIILMVLIISIQECGILLHLFVSSSFSSLNVLQFLEYRSFVSLGSFIPRLFILFDVMVSGVVYLISLSDHLLLVYQNTQWTNTYRLQQNQF